MARDENELESPPVFEIGDKVCLTKTIKNDGTFGGKELREVLAKKGEIGYVVSIGTYLQTFYIYGVHFIELGIVVGCRCYELKTQE